MVPAQCTHRVDDPVHVPQFHAVHLSVEFVEVLLDGSIVHPVGFRVSFVEQCQYRIAVSEVWRIFCDIASQFFKVLFQINHLQSVVMLTLKSKKRKTAIFNLIDAIDVDALAKGIINPNT